MTPKNNKEYNPLRPWSNYLQPGLLEQVDEVIGTKKLYLELSYDDLIDLMLND